MEEVHKLYGNKVRVRACGLLVSEDRLLMVNHSSLGKGSFWSPPGGGIEFGETAASCLEREFLEETGLRITAGELAFTCEFVRPPLHAVELFFRVSVVGGRLTTGADPEMGDAPQLIRAVRFLSWGELERLPAENIHGVFGTVTTPSSIMQLNGYLTI